MKNIYILYIYKNMNDDIKKLKKNINNDEI